MFINKDRIMITSYSTMSPKPQDPAPLSLLCIDDDTDVLDTFSTVLNREPDINLVTCSSPIVALDRLKSQNADAIFCDFSMPDMDGIEFLREIRSRGNNAFFVICTGRHLTRVAIDALNSGGNFYLQKGVTMMDEMPKVIEAIRQHRNNRDTASPPRSLSSTPPSTRPSAPPADSPSQSFIDNQFVPLCGFDRNGRIRYANSFYTREISTKAGGSAGFFSVIPDDERAEFMNHLKALSTQNPATHLLHHVRLDNGPLKLVLGNYRVFMDGSGEVTGYTALLTPMSGIISLSSLALHSLEEPKVKPEPVIQKVSLPSTGQVPCRQKRRNG